jgi:hypothetical protein
MVMQQKGLHILSATGRRIQQHVFQRQRQPSLPPPPSSSSMTQYQHYVRSSSHNATMPQTHQRPHLLLTHNNQSRLFGTRRKRYQPSSNNKSKSQDYWDKEYIKSKLQLESISKNKLQIEEPKQLNDIISWRVLLIMAVSPLVLCLIIPDLRNQMLDSLDIPSTTQSSSYESSNQNKK